MTANLLAHSDLFAAGIARSGAYNRTLTPFGFQTERRTYWEAPDIYIKMSPFTYADKIKTPILLIHGEADNNSGTFPIQSERLFQAIRGNGGTARLVLLPYEAHGYRARESVLHTLAEMLEWGERWTRETPPEAGTGELAARLERLHEQVLLHLPERVARQLRNDADVARLLVVGEMLGREGGDVLADGLGPAAAPGSSSTSGRGDALAPDAVGKPDDGRVLHGRVPAEDVLDLARRDLEAAALDDVDRACGRRSSRSRRRRGARRRPSGTSRPGTRPPSRRAGPSSRS